MHIRCLLSCLSLALLANSPLFAQGQGNRIFGAGHPFTEQELPAGELKAKLNKLKPQARAEAMKRLHSFSFPESDAAKFIRVDQDGGIFIVCPIDGCGDDCGHGHEHGHAESTEQTAPADAAGNTTVSSENIPIGDGSNETFNPTSAVAISSPPAFHSKPGAPFHIYLDFNGGRVSRKAWSYSDGTKTWTSWNCAAWSTDSDTSTFSVSDQNDIRRMWERIAEDYAPFNVNVTTDVAYDPDQYRGDKNKVGWVLITPTTDIDGVPCPHYGYGGVAYANVFGRADYFSQYQPAWITPMGAANTAEAASHEMGHNMGLAHDGTNVGGYGTEYYGGHGATPSAPSWGPLMGTGYDRDVSQWSKSSEYYGGNHYFDDLAIIAGKVGYNGDDHGGTLQTATVWAQSPVNQPGVVERTGDQDVFTFATGAGSVSFSANTYRCDTQTWGGNLDAVLELYDSTQTLIASSNPLADTDASISTSVPAGRYYLVVKPTGAGSPLSSTPSGYTNYGSLGYYSITGTYSPVDSIFVTAPNGGEFWLNGTSKEITWVSGVGGNVSIELLKNGVLDSIISSSTPNDGSFIWAIPSAQASDSDYKIRITNLSNPSINVESFSSFSIVVGLPLPWVSADIGTGMLAGSATFAAGTFTQAGSGAISGKSDMFRYTHQTLSGDGEIIARITNLQDTGTGSRVGVMIRDTLAANSKEIFMGMSGSNTYRWVRRTATNGTTSTTSSSTGTVPNTWVRLVRSGTTITAYKSTDGTTWTTVGSTTGTSFASTCYIGLAVGSGSNTTLNTSQFSNLSVTP